VSTTLRHYDTTTLGHEVQSYNNRNDYQRQKMFLGSQCGRCLRLIISPPSVSGLSRQCAILNISQPYRPPWPVTRTALFLYVDDVRTSQETRASTACYGDNFTFLYVDVRTSQKTRASTACYGDNFTFLYVDDVRTSQETRTSTACYGDNFTFLYVNVRTSQKTRASTACYGDNFTFYM
jgi:hypothetical protein